MRRRRSFVPSWVANERLEERIVLHGATRQVATSVLLQGLNGSPNQFHAHNAPATAALINLAYQSFQQDFTAVRATYLAAVQNGTAKPDDMTAFQNYTIQRTNLLAQQVTNALLLYKPGASRGPKLDSPLPLIVFQINGVADRKAMPRQAIPLVTQLTGLAVSPSAGRTMPATGSTAINPLPGPGASPTTIAVDTIAQDNAIQASLVMTLNSITVLRNGDFGNSNGNN